MGRPKKETDNEAEDLDTSELDVAVSKNKKIKVNLDIASLVKDVRGRYGKDKAGLANDIVLGNDIRMPTEDTAYILSSEVEFWKPLVGVKGIPYGRIVQVSGKPDSGKSTTAMLFMKAAQDDGSLVILWDSEKKFDVKRYECKIGGDASQLVVSRNKLITEGVKQVAWYVKEAKEQNPDLKIFIVWDSVGSTLNSSQDDEDDEFSKQPGVTAKEVGFAITKLNSLIERYRNVKTGEDTIAVLCINQVYANIGSVGHKERGGGQLEYLSSVILQLSRKKDLTKIRNGQPVKYGILTRAKVKKNHLFSGEDCIAELDLVVTSTGISLEEKVRASFVKNGIIEENDSLDD